MTIISTTVGKNPLEEIEEPSLREPPGQDSASQTLSLGEGPVLESTDVSR